MQENAEELLDRIARRLRAMGNPFRLRILLALEHGELSVNRILAIVGSSQGKVSKHLSVLSSADLVTRRRDGTNVFYAISDDTALTVCRTVCDALQSHTQREADSFEKPHRIERGLAGVTSSSRLR